MSLVRPPTGSAPTIRPPTAAAAGRSPSASISRRARTARWRPRRVSGSSSGRFEGLLDALEAAVERLALEVQGARGLGLAAAALEVDLQGAQELGGAGVALIQERPELLAHERDHLDRRAQAEEEVDDRAAARVLPGARCAGARRGSSADDAIQRGAERAPRVGGAARARGRPRPPADRSVRASRAVRRRHVRAARTAAPCRPCRGRAARRRRTSRR